MTASPAPSAQTAAQAWGDHYWRSDCPRCAVGAYCRTERLLADEADSAGLRVRRKDGRGW